ncbi:ribbon-helix-helix protein, CopG family [Nanohaloarchaea archaeon H01]|nr:ribbon-helix-helix protein, CopG family [Nanohaloarchaea archaeon H01]
MPTVSVNLPEKMKEKLSELTAEGLYQNESEYIRSALREKIKNETGLTPAEEKELLKRIEQVEKGEADLVSLEEV